MNPIQQIYCTHCTYGSSALEQREGELADRVLGYSARAGSVERNELRGYYRQVERFLYYYLPSDSPPDERLKLDAATAPCRMFFSPSIGRLQMLGQVVYRKLDTAGRAGSYFAHVLFGERDAAPWPVLDCLGLWSAPWVVDDTPEHPKRLPALARLDELRQGRPAAIDDGVLLSFLTTPPGEAFQDPRGVIPERWRSMPRAQRAELLIDIAQGYIELGSNRRESVLMVCEPSLAALVFYGVARLLPAGAVREGVSFSTYEPSADRLPVALAATTFYTPETTDLKPDAYRRRGYAYNTFLQTRSGAGRPAGTYARLMVETLLAEGWPAVDALLEGFAEAGCGKLEELEALAQTHRLAPRLLDPAATLEPKVWTGSAVAERYLGAAVERQLAAAPNAPQLRALIGSPRQMLVLELAAARAGAESSPSVQFLLRHVPPERLHEVYSSQRIGWQAKVETLVFQLCGTGRIPDGCELLWEQGAGAVKRAGAGGPPLLSAALARLPQSALESLHRAIPDERGEAFVVALARACPIEPRRQVELQRYLGEVVAALDEQRLVGLLSRCRADLQASYAKPEPLLAHRLSKLLYEIPDRPREFAQRLEALSGWVDHFPDPGLAEQRLAQWRKVHSILQSLGDGEAKKSGRFFKGKAKPDYKGLAEALRKAMPEAVYADDPSGTMKKKRLRELGTQIVGSPDFLPPAVWNTITRYFEYGDWADGAKSMVQSKGPRRSPSGKPLTKRGGKSKRGPQGGGWFGRWIVLLAICLGSGLGVVIYGTWLHTHSTSAVAENEQRGSEQKADVPAATRGESKKAAPKPASTETTQSTGRDPTRNQTGPDKSKKPSKAKNDSADGAPTDDQDSQTENNTDGEKQSPTDEAAGKPDEASPDMASSSEGSNENPDMPDESQETGQTNAGKTAKKADSDVAPTRNGPSASGGHAPAKTSKPATPPPRAKNVYFPPADSFKLVELSSTIPASSDYKLQIFGPSYKEQRLFVTGNGEMSNKRQLCSLPERLYEKREHNASKPIRLGLFDVSPEGLAFRWSPSDKDADRRKWFCERGFVLRLASDETRLYFALYQPKQPAAIEINPKTSSGPIMNLENLVEGRALRLGPGKVYFSDETVRKFDEAPDGATSVLKPAVRETNTAPFEVHLEKSKTGSGAWTMGLVPQNATKKSNAPVPKYVSAVLYRVVEFDGKTKVRVDEVIIGPPKPGAK